MARLTALEEEAKAANRGKWGPNPDKVGDVYSAVMFQGTFSVFYSPHKN